LDRFNLENDHFKSSCNFRKREESSCLGIEEADIKDAIADGTYTPAID
jgi:hypothetical protein